MVDLQMILRQRDLRVTTPRQMVFDVLSQAHEPLSLRAVADLADGIDRSTVYRTIDTFIAIGVVKVTYLGWKKRFELAEAFNPHHHHIRCVSCGRLAHVEEPALEEMLESIAQRHGFTMTAHHVELEGTCEKCRT